MAILRPEVTGRSYGVTAKAEISPLKFALTIREFCQSHNISPAFFYLLQQRGEGPRVMHVGSRRLISIEEARRWRTARTAAGNETAVKPESTLHKPHSSGDAYCRSPAMLDHHPEK